MTLNNKTSYLLKVIIEEDGFEDGRQAYHAFCPALRGCHTWGYTQKEALSNIQEVAQMIVEECKEDGLPLREDKKQVGVLSRVYVTVSI